MCAENITPTRMNLLSRRSQVKLASDGLSILRGKREALLKDLIRRARLLRDKQRELQHRGREANAALAMARAVRGTAEVESVTAAGERSLAVSVQIEKLWGLRLGTVEHGSVIRAPQDRGISRVDYSTHVFDAAAAAEAMVEQMLECSPLELQVTTLGEEIRKLGRRINAIEEYLIPRLREEIAFIKSVLEEREREERFRLKRVKKKKSRAKVEEVADVAE